MASPPVIDHIAIVTMTGENSSCPMRNPFVAPIARPSPTSANDQAVTPASIR